MSDDPDILTEMVATGWTVAGYSTAMMAAGAMVHSILMRDGDKLTTVNIIKTGDKEVGRTVDVFVPAPPKKKGWF
jgi:hypothetical protein